MLTANQLRQVAGRSGARDIGNVEIDVILTYLLQLFAEKGIMDHVGFKGGTMLRKMVFGPRGRLSTDLDFTSHSDIDAEDLMLMMLDALDRPYHGISFRFDREKDWYLTEDGCAANPVCAHAENENGVKIKLQVSMRERPVLPIRPMPQIALDYFNLLEFVPVAVRCLAFEEVVAEKIRAALVALCDMITFPVPVRIVSPAPVFKDESVSAKVAMPLGLPEDFSQAVFSHLRLSPNLTVLRLESAP